MLQRREQLLLLHLTRRCLPGACKERPGLRFERQLATLPSAPSQLHPCLEDRELVGPGRKAAEPAVVVETRKDAHHCVVRSLERHVVEISAAQVRKRRTAPGDLETRGPEQ